MTKSATPTTSLPAAACMCAMPCLRSRVAIPLV